MSLPLEFHRLVRDEIDQAHDWYEQRLVGLGREFLDEVERVLGVIAATPTLYAIVEADIREALLRRFPYAIYYRALADRVRVLAVYHTARDPAGWQSRAP